jgi:ABC-2 type transport system permease protein
VSDVSLAVAQTRYSVKGYLRDPSALVFTIIMPVVLLLLFNAIFHGNTLFDGIRVKSAAYYTASIIAYTIMLNGFGSLVIRITTDREAGQLKRPRGTPMPSWVYLFAEIGRSVVTIVVTSGVLLAVGALFYGVTVSGHMVVGLVVYVVVGLVVYVVVGTACFAALGLALARACRTTDSASAIGPFSTVVLAFLSGVFIPVAIMPAWLLDIGKVFPLEHLARGLQLAFLVPGSTGLTGTNLAVLVAWGVVGLLVAIRTFRWDPLAAGAG